jgi:hypothetical protein
MNNNCFVNLTNYISNVSQFGRELQRVFENDDRGTIFYEFGVTGAGNVRIDSGKI